MPASSPSIYPYHQCGNSCLFGHENKHWKRVLVLVSANVEKSVRVWSVHVNQWIKRTKMNEEESKNGKWSQIFRVCTREKSLVDDEPEDEKEKDLIFFWRYVFLALCGNVC